jgi:hypothetical protein
VYNAYSLRAVWLSFMNPFHPDASNTSFPTRREAQHPVQEDVERLDAALLPFPPTMTFSFFMRDIIALAGLTGHHATRGIDMDEWINVAARPDGPVGSPLVNLHVPSNAPPSSINLQYPPSSVPPPDTSARSQLGSRPVPG